MNAAREYYDFMKHKSKFRKVNLLLLISIILMEILLVVTQGKSNSILMKMNSAMPIYSL